MSDEKLYSSLGHFYLDLPNNKVEPNNEFGGFERCCIKSGMTIHEWLSLPHIKMYDRIIQRTKRFIFRDANTDKVKFSFLFKKQSFEEFHLHIEMFGSRDVRSTQLNPNDLKFLCFEIENSEFCIFDRSYTFQLQKNQEQKLQFLSFVYTPILNFELIYRFSDWKRKSVEKEQNAIQILYDEISEVRKKIDQIKSG